MWTTVIFSLIALVGWSNSAESTNNKTNLEGIILIVQNGYTGIKSNETYPNDIYNSPEFWPSGYNQLTISGKQQIYALGQSVNQRYNNILPSNPHNVYIQSYDNDPCFETAEVFAAGSLPPTKEWAWNDRLNWQPIRIHTQPASSDNILGTSIPCKLPTLNTIETQEAFRQINASHASLLSYVAEASGWSTMNIQQFVDLYQIITLEEHENLPKQPWLNQTVWNELEKIIHDLAYLVYNDHLVQRIVAGPLLSQLTKDAESIQNQKGPKAYIYVTDQSKMISLLTSLLINNTQELITKPGSLIALEIYREPEKGPYFNFVYNDGDQINQWKNLIVFGCDYNCPMDHLYRSAKTFAPIKPEEVCNRKTNDDLIIESPSQDSIVETTNDYTLPPISNDATVAHSSGGLNAFLVTVLCFVSALIILLGVSMIYSRRRRNDYTFI